MSNNYHSKGHIMTIKQMLFSVLIIGTAINSILAMEETAEQREQNKKKFEANIAQLNQPVADFVRDFITWPKEEQDKIVIFNNTNDIGYVVIGRPAASDKYNGNIGYYLDCRLNQRQITPFLSALDYLKKQK